MPDLTPIEAAEIIMNPHGYGTSERNAAECMASDALRQIAAGEYRQVVHGKWKEVEPGHDILFKCSNCGRIVSTSWGSCEDEDTHGCNGCDPTEEWLNCPSCGALMDGKDDSHED
ncbi:MAG: hypothetical protein ACQGTM_15515 [bacterium]